MASIDVATLLVVGACIASPTAAKMIVNAIASML